MLFQLLFKSIQVSPDLVLAMVYLWEGSLLPFMEGMEKHDKHISMQFFNLWNERKVNINGMVFEITEEVIAGVGGFFRRGQELAQEG